MKDYMWAGGEYSRKAENYRNRNSALRALITRAENELLELEKDGRILSMTDNRLKEHLKTVLFGRREAAKVFVDYLDEFVAKKEKAGTKSIYTTTRNKITAFDKWCTFETMGRKWLERFDQRKVDEANRRVIDLVNGQNNRS